MISRETFIKNQRVLVIGHMNSDVDSLASAVMFAKIMRKNGLNAHPAIIDRENIAKETLEFLDESLNRDLDDFIDEIREDDLFVLVDHNDPGQSIGYKAYEEGRIIAVIDHHDDLGYNYGLKEIKPSGATLKIIYDLYPQYVKRDLVSEVILFDTCGLYSEKANLEDIKFVKEVYESKGLNLEDERQKYIFETELFQPLESVLGQTRKKHNSEVGDYHSSTIDIFLNSDDKRSKLEELIRFSEKEKSILIVKDFYSKTTYVKGAFKGRILNERYEGIRSRNKLLPLIENL